MTDYLPLMESWASICSSEPGIETVPVPLERLATITVADQIMKKLISEQSYFIPKGVLNYIVKRKSGENYEPPEVILIYSRPMITERVNTLPLPKCIRDEIVAYIGFVGLSLTDWFKKRLGKHGREQWLGKSRKLYVELEMSLSDEDPMDILERYREVPRWARWTPALPGTWVFEDEEMDDFTSDSES